VIKLKLRLISVQICAPAALASYFPPFHSTSLGKVSSNTSKSLASRPRNKAISLSSLSSCSSAGPVRRKTGAAWECPAQWLSVTASGS